MAEHGDQLARKLLTLKKELDEKKTQRAELQGERKSIMAQLKKDFGVSTLEEAEALQAAEKKAIQQQTEDLTQKLNEIEDMLLV